MEAWDALRARRDVRRFTDQAIAGADLDRILEAGWRAPSSANRQERDFVFVTDRAQLRQLAEVWQGAGHVAHSAATVGVITPDEDDPRVRAINAVDIGQAVMMMMIAAADRGIGSGHSAVADQDLARELLGFPPARYCALLVSFGYPADRPLRPIEHPARRPFDEVVHRGRW